MTVAEIKEYITQKINYYKGENYYHTLRTNTVLLDFEQIGIMLDELEPNENTSQWVQHYKICGYVCDNCGHISEIKDNVCSNCGARMIDELKENNK